MPFDIEAYLSGAMPADEQARFETAMQQDSALREDVERQRELIGHLRAQRIREIVAKTLYGHPVSPDSLSFWRKWRSLIFTGVLILLLAAGWRLYYTLQTPVIPEPAILPSPENTYPGTPQREEELPVQAPQRSNHRPIARQGPISGRSRFEGMTFTRGDGDTLPADLQKRLEEVWFTAFDSTAAHYTPRFQPAVTALGRQDFATAFIELGEQEKSAPDNDTLAYLKGYCLLELFACDEAARYLKRLDAPGKPWRAEALWYSGLGYLLTDEREMAKAQWEKVLALPEPLWRKNARKGLQQLKK